MSSVRARIGLEVVKFQSLPSEDVCFILVVPKVELCPLRIKLDERRPGVVEVKGVTLGTGRRRPG
jgi:hypothetical protein